LDILFLMRMIQLVWAESKELLPAAQNGWDGLLDYLEFWNIVDWVSVFSGIWVAALWGQIASFITGQLNEDITNLPAYPAHSNFYSGDSELEPPFYLSRADMVTNIENGDETYFKDIEKLHDDFTMLSGQLGTLRLVLSLFTFVLMLRFFKAFRANPRLSLATNTLSEAAVDIIHFFVVFMTIYVSFAVIGHSSFGHQLYLFSSVELSLITCFTVLMGDFDLQEMMAVDSTMAIIWFFGFQILVMLVLLNMLLAIVMDTYGSVKASEGDDVETVWAQASSTYRWMNETRGFVPMWPIICELEDDDDPAHPMDIVSADSLRQAFSNRDNLDMQFRQAQFIIKSAVAWSSAEVDKAGELRPSHIMPTLTQVKGMIKRLQDKMGGLQVSVEWTVSNLSFMQQQMIMKERMQTTNDMQTTAGTGPGSPAAANTTASSGNNTQALAIVPKSRTPEYDRPGTGESMQHYDMPSADAAAMEDKLRDMLEIGSAFGKTMVQKIDGVDRVAKIIEKTQGMQSGSGSKEERLMTTIEDLQKAFDANSELQHSMMKVLKDVRTKQGQMERKIEDIKNGGGDSDDYEIPRRKPRAISGDSFGKQSNTSQSRKGGGSPVSSRPTSGVSPPQRPVAKPVKGSTREGAGPRFLS